MQSLIIFDSRLYSMTRWYFVPRNPFQRQSLRVKVTLSKSVNARWYDVILEAVDSRRNDSSEQQAPTKKKGNLWKCKASERRINGVWENVLFN